MANVFLQAEELYGLSAVYLAVHAAIETENGTSSLSNGTLKRGSPSKPVYNMYGIGAFDGKAEILGADMAMSQGWFTPELAILGGAKWILEKYPTRKSPQKKTYDMRWNPENMVGSQKNPNQYATAVNWAEVQSEKFHSIFIQMNLVMPLIFTIPRYKKSAQEKNNSLEPSGAQWHSRFPDETTLDALAEPFKSNVEEFLNAINNAGGNIRITSVKRPKERAYLMHWSYQIKNNSFPPQNVPNYDSIGTVNIDWSHRDENGNIQLDKAIKGASDMNELYKSRFQPSLTSNHTKGLAIDMYITNIIGKTVKLRSGGPDKLVSSQDDLWMIAKTYGVIKHPTDKPHWSYNGK